MKLIAAAAVLSVMMAGCTEPKPEQVQVDINKYRVNDAPALQARLDELNAKLVQEYAQMKHQNAYAFADGSALDASDLMTLNMQAVSATALKPVKENYCAVMNNYFNELYRLGHFNIQLLPDVQIKHAPQQNLAQTFLNAQNFYQFILNDYSSYKQAQQQMGLGCNLLAALSPAA